MNVGQMIGLLLALLFLSVSTFTSWHLYRVWCRTRRAPELLMMIGLLGVGPLGFGPSLVAEGVQATSPETSALLRILGMFGVSVGAIGFTCFTQVVFRTQAGWARTLVFFVALGFAALMIQTVLDYRATGSDRIDPAMLARGVLLSLIWGWMGVECLRYRAIMRRRLALGLADPVVVNRFALWALVSIGSVVINTFGTVMGVRAGANAMDDELVVIVTGAIGMIDSVGIYLAFLPPRRYEAWIRRIAATGSPTTKTT